jgi:hypothetical protein
MRRWVRLCIVLLAATYALSIVGCSSPSANIALVGATTVVGAQAPNNEIEQVYYLGIFDPQEQLPPAVYRLTVHGQASFLSLTRFASGWVPASLVDTLNTQISFSEKDGSLQVAGKSDTPNSGLPTGRRLMLFGPEGFREAPRDHRLAIVMGSSPEDFFGAVGDSLAAVTSVQVEQANGAASNAILKELLRLQEEQGRLKDLQNDVKPGATVAAASGGASETKGGSK